MSKFYLEGLFGFEIDDVKAAELLASAESARSSKELKP